jgi:hypothetical protein
METTMMRQGFYNFQHGLFKMGMHNQCGRLCGRGFFPEKTIRRTWAVHEGQPFFKIYLLEALRVPKYPGCCCWPYANSHIHVGNITGSYLPADIYARYHRLLGNQVLMVSGSDPMAHLLLSEQMQRVSLQWMFIKNTTLISGIISKIGDILRPFHQHSYEKHFKVSQTFLPPCKKMAIYIPKKKSMVCPSQGRFLPDRYVEGTCYICGYTMLAAINAINVVLTGCYTIIDPRSKVDGLP